MRHRLAVLVLVVAISLLPQHARAQWQPDGVAISIAVNDQYLPKIVSDGAGGAIVTWEDLRSGNRYKVYAQRVNALGVPQWAADGVALCPAANDQREPTIVSDGAGGAIVTWRDFRSEVSWDVYSQRVNASGTPQWSADGIALCTDVDNQLLPTIVSDGVGGAIVTWYDYRPYFDYDIYAQRVNATGVPQWTSDGVALCTAAESQYNPMIVSDGAGGAIVTWYDYRSGNTDIYAQRVNASGAPQWTADGVALCTAANTQIAPEIASDGAEGAIVTWRDYRSGTSFDIYAQRVNTTGTPQWTADGVALCIASNRQADPTIVSDGAGGAFVAWEDERSGTSSDIYTQRVDASGISQWTADGVVLSQALYSTNPTIVVDGAGGAIVTWEDSRSETNIDIYAQRVNASGAPQWSAGGVAFCTALNDQRSPTLVSDNAGGAIVTWHDRRSGTNWDIYAQYVPETPNAVAIMSFDASETDGVVTLRSAFRSDLGVESVNVYRTVGTDDDPLKIIERADDVRGDGFEYLDRDVAPGQTYRYQIGVVDADGEFFSPIATVSVHAITGELSQNQPNPFNPTTTIRFTLPAREDVTLAIYDTNGHLVRTLVNGVEGYGAHEVTWDGRDNDGATMGSGVYFYRLRAGKVTESKKMVLLK